MVTVVPISCGCLVFCVSFFFFSSRRRHTIFKCDWSSDVCSSDLAAADAVGRPARVAGLAGAGRPPEDQRPEPVGQQHPPQQLAFAEELFLADELVEAAQIGRASCREKWWMYDGRGRGNGRYVGGA